MNSNEIINNSSITAAIVRQALITTSSPIIDIFAQLNKNRILKRPTTGNLTTCTPTFEHIKTLDIPLLVCCCDSVNRKMIIIHESETVGMGQSVIFVKSLFILLEIYS